MSSNIFMKINVFYRTLIFMTSIYPQPLAPAGRKVTLLILRAQFAY